MRIHLALFVFLGMSTLVDAQTFDPASAYAKAVEHAATRSGRSISAVERETTLGESSTMDGQIITIGRSGDHMVVYLGGTEERVSHSRDGGATWSAWVATPPETQATCGTELSNDEKLSIEKFIKAKSARDASGPARIDILIVYTQAFSQAVGGPDGVRARMNAGFAYLNTSFANSGINAYAYPIGPIAVDWTEGPLQNQLGDSLNWMRANTNIIRNERLADLVHMYQFGPFPPSGGTYVGGRASLFTGSSDASVGVTANMAFSDGPSTFTHEIGHNLSAGHSPEDGCGSFAGACGYYEPVATLPSGFRYRDFMTYFSVPGCASGCLQVNIFSSPNLTYPNGSATGTGNAKNAYFVDMVAPIVEAFRVYTAPAPIPLSPGALSAILLSRPGNVIFRDGFER